MNWRPLLLLAALLGVGAAEPPPKPVPLDPREAARQGRALADEILAQSPTEDSTNRGVMKIRDEHGKRVEFPIEFIVRRDSNGWRSIYRTLPGRNPADGPTWELEVRHDTAGHPRYSMTIHSPGPATATTATTLSGDRLNEPFAGNSDFWISDLGLEFFHWPEQRVIKSGMQEGHTYRVLESINPNPSPHGYSRVVSRIDTESDGILLAEAYDANNKSLKTFAPKGFKKVNGVWQVEEMEMINNQADSRTLIRFTFDSK